MRQELLPARGKFYKANLHMHTTISDGELTPEEVKRVFSDHGYSIVAFTDHEIIVPHNDLTDEHFLALTGFETAVNLPHPPSWDFDFMTACHMNFYAKDSGNVLCPAFCEEGVWLKHSRKYVTDAMRALSRRRDYSAECFNRMIAEANAAGFLVSLNHPVWSLQNYSDYCGMKGLWGVEVYNAGCALAGFPDTVQPLDDLLRLGQHVLPLSTDDGHLLQNCFYGYVMVKAESLTYDAVMQALEHGDLYASTGPSVGELFCEDGILHITTSPAAEITLTTERRFAVHTTAEPDEPLLGARFDLREYLHKSRTGPDANKNCYFRITIKDAAGRCAWTRAYFADEIG
ncbi:MAG TPA: hypothetical protein H9676_07250 [Firmicutes bacterium]|nr:hypothetical protein [Bacillota bacterium]